MQLALALFPDVDGLDGLIDESMPWFAAWLILLAISLLIMLAGKGIARLRRRSPVEQLLHRRFG